MSWRVATSLVRLRDQVNAAYPNRNKASDGTIGDAAHAAGASDHNPNAAGVVCALDITHDPANGCDTFALADRLRVNRHPDLKYLISNRRIAGAWTNWQWVAYGGSDPHTNHVHVSVGRGNDGQSTPPYDDATDWAVGGGTPPATQGGKSNDQVAREVVAGQWGNGVDRQNALAAAGYNYNTIQNLVNAIVGTPQASQPARKSNEDVAVEVRKGYWGNGDDRKNKLEAAGYDYNAVQAIVNATVSTPVAVQKSSNDEIATQVLRGDWGNGDDRKNRLKNAGYDYDAIQAIVNGQVSAKPSESDVANAVIRGEYGNGADRVNRLRAAGYNPDSIQAIVNQRV